MVWEKIETQIWDPKEGDMIEGVLVNKKTDQGKFKSKTYSIEVIDKETNTPKPFLVYGSTILDDKMSFVTVGSKVQIKYLGLEKAQGSGQDVKKFEVLKER